MSAVAFADRCTQVQRDYVRTLLERAELPGDRFAYAHRPVFKAARLPEPDIDGHVDTHLRTLNRAEASRLIRALKQHVGLVDDLEND